MTSFRSPFYCIFAFVLVVSTLVLAQTSDVTTWHNDINRTGWQQNETLLTATQGQSGSVNQNSFGLLWQWSIPGGLDAQPLAMGNLPTVGTCLQPCNLVFVATEDDHIYAYNADSTSATPPVWTANLAGGLGGTYVDCTIQILDFGPCSPAEDGGNTSGITGTPVIDTANKILYAVGAISVGGIVEYDLFAIDILQAGNNAPLASIKITGTANGKNPGQDQSHRCTSTYGTGGYGPINFTNDERQRAALLLLNNVVYIAFAPGGDTNEYLNGWLFGYKLGSGSFSQVEMYNTSPYGTGGGIWGSGGGLSAEVRSNANYVYASTGNGTFDLTGVTPIANDVGDTAMKYAVIGSTGSLTPVDYYTPSNVNSYIPPGGSVQGVCQNDADFGSGSVLVFPDNFYTDTSHNPPTTPNLAVIGDKQSNLYVLNRDSMGHFNLAGGNLTELTHVRYDHMGLPQKNQGFWSTPAYWKYMDGSTPRYRLYAGATSQDLGIGAFPMDMYALLTSGNSGPISTTGPTASTSISFCRYAPQPIVSSNGTTAGTGIVWGIEKLNADFPTDCASKSGKAVLDAFDATSMSLLFTSRLITTAIGGGQAFATPTVFNHRVYVISNNTLAVFGLCSQNPLCLQ